MDACLPPVSIHISEEGTGRRKVLRVDVDEMPKKPCCTSSGSYKIRKNGTKVAIDPELLAAMILERESEQFLGRFKTAGDSIMDALEDVKSYLELKIDSVESIASDALSAASEAAEAASECL